MSSISSSDYSSFHPSRLSTSTTDLSDIFDDINQPQHEWFSSSLILEPVILGSNEIEPGYVTVYYDHGVYMDDLTAPDINIYGIKAGQVIRIQLFLFQWKLVDL